MSSSGPPDLAVREVARGGAWSIANQVAVFAAGFAAIPIVTRELGPELYGLLALVNTIAAYLLLADLGMGVASTRFGAVAYQDGDAAREASVVWTALALALIPSAATCGVILIFSEHVARVVGVPAHLLGEASVGLRFISLSVAFRIASLVLNTCAVVRLRMEITSAIGIFATAGPLIASPIVLLSGGAVEDVCLATAIISGGAFAMHLIACGSINPEFRKPVFSRELVRPMLTFGVSVAASGVIGAILSAGERFIIARYLSLSALGFYAVAASLASIIAIAPMAAVQVLLPAFSRLDRDPRALERFYQCANRANILVVGPIFLGAVALGEPFLRYWAGPDYVADSSKIFLVLLVGLVFNVLTSAPVVLLQAVGRTDVVAKIHAAELVPHVAFTIVLTVYFGPLGAACAWSLRVVIDAVLMFTFAASRSAIASGVLWGRTGALVIMTVVPMAVLVSSLDSAAQRLLIGFVAAAVFAVGAWTRVLVEADRAWIQARVGRRG